jgi:methyltransferase (TIGR00027 family)
MNVMSAVSETAIFTLKARVVESERDNPIIQDEIGQKCLERIRPLLSADTRDKIFDRRLPTSLTVYIALRARQYDRYASAFIKENPDGLVVNLGAGFDTRYWRVSDQPWNYVEIDLPEVVAVKQEVLADLITYRLIGRSVMEEGWVEEIQAIQKENVLFLAEGLLMYLPRPAVIDLFNKLTTSFTNSQFVFEVVHERYTKGLWKKGVEARMKRRLGSDAGSSYQFGVRQAQDIESLANNIRVVEEWSYFEDEDIRPSFLRLFRHFDFVAKTQWTIKTNFGQ